MADDDWRPKLTRIEDPIADDYWRYTTPQGKRRTSRLTVGRPVHFPQERCWYVPVMIEGYLTKVTPVFGQGPVDSLINALTVLKNFHEEVGEIVPCVKPQTAVRKKTARKAGGKAAPSKAQSKRSNSSSRSR